MNASAVSPATASSILVTKEWKEGNAHYQELSWKDFVITQRLATSAPIGGEYLPSKVVQDSKVVWRFHKGNDLTMAFLRDYGDEPVLVLTSPRRVHEILFVADLPKLIPIKVKGMDTVIPVRAITDLALCKRAIAEDMGFDPLYRAEELRAIYDFDVAERTRREAATAAARQIHETKRLADEAAAQAEKERKAQAHAEKIAKILARQKVVCYTKEGGNRRHGIPVVGDEWMCLKNDTFCILVASYDDARGTPGDVMESFRVMKNASKVKKQCQEPVQKHLVGVASSSSPTTEIEAEEVSQLIVGGKLLSVPVYVGIKPSSVNFPYPFGIRVGSETTLYSRESGTLRAIGVHRMQVAATPA